MVTGTLMNYYIHCKRQCYLAGNRLNLEDNSEQVKIGKALHEEKERKNKNAEIQIEYIKLDGLTKDYIIEYKKSDADVEACRWQMILYLSELKKKGIIRKGKIEFFEKKTKSTKTEIIELTDEMEEKLGIYVEEIEKLIQQEKIPETLNKSSCKKCAYFEYCYIQIKKMLYQFIRRCEWEIQDICFLWED